MNIGISRQDPKGSILKVTQALLIYVDYFIINIMVGLFLEWPHKADFYYIVQSVKLIFAKTDINLKIKSKSY